ncbi:MAG: DinB family protein, partial [Candidatus Rokuibacteriota bacterium]
LRHDRGHPVRDGARRPRLDSRGLAADVINSVGDFIRYFEGVRRRTRSVIEQVSPELLDWRPRPGEFTCSDIVRHLAGAERFFVTKVLEDRWTADLDPGLPLDHGATRAHLDEVHRAEMGRLADLPDERLQAPLRDLDGGQVKTWRLLMAMVEHEVHHRSQLDAYLAEAGVEPPQLYGYRMEDVVARATFPEGRR